jgi:hypothetical protein
MAEEDFKEDESLLTTSSYKLGRNKLRKFGEKAINIRKKIQEKTDAIDDELKSQPADGD